MKISANPLSSPAVRGLLVIALAAGLTACGNKSGTAKPTQVIAKVNDAELSVHQLNFALQSAGQVPPDKLAEVRKSALERLVEQEALVQEAIAKKVDRDPSVQQQLEAARKDILVRNHLQKVAGAVAAPTSDAVDKYYTENPGLFKERTVYQFTELTFPRPPANWPEIEKALLPAKTIQEVLNLLRQKGFNLPVAQNIVRASEDLPMEVIKRIPSIKDGEIVIYQRGPSIVIAQINARKSMPVEQDKAKPLIERYLTNRARTEAMQAEIKRVRTAAKVTYQGEFEPGAAAPAAAPAKPAEPTAKPSDKDVLEKGIKGLK